MVTIKNLDSITLADFVDNFLLKDLGLRRSQLMLLHGESIVYDAQDADDSDMSEDELEMIKKKWSKTLSQLKMTNNTKLGLQAMFED